MQVFQITDSQTDAFSFPLFSAALSGFSLHSGTVLSCCILQSSFGGFAFCRMVVFCRFQCFCRIFWWMIWFVIRSLNEATQTIASYISLCLSYIHRDVCMVISKHCYMDQKKFLLVHIAIHFFCYWLYYFYREYILYL